MVSVTHFVSIPNLPQTNSPHQETSQKLAHPCHVLHYPCVLRFSNFSYCPFPHKTTLNSRTCEPKKHLLPFALGFCRCMMLSAMCPTKARHIPKKELPAATTITHNQASSRKCRMRARGQVSPSIEAFFVRYDSQGTTQDQSCLVLLGHTILWLSTRKRALTISSNMCRNDDDCDDDTGEPNQTLHNTTPRRSDNEPSGIVWYRGRGYLCRFLIEFSGLFSNSLI